ncbi:MAG: hypothetical protein MZV65_16925 [Chromatiales bacterium]|nr:hypothetical protein [Chromatiales bacterium]
MSEGRAARIKKISIVGNTVFDDETLLEDFQLSTPTMLSFYTGVDQYSKQKLSGDLETLRSYYLDRGYINFNIDSDTGIDNAGQEGYLPHHQHYRG